MGSYLTTWLVIIVSLVWAANFLADIFKDNWDPSPLIHAAMLAVVWAVLGSKTVGRLNGNHKKTVKKKR